MLRALSKSQNWPAGSWPDQTFWQNRLFPRGFAEQPSTLCIIFRNWLIWIVSFAYKLNSHYDGIGLASQFWQMESALRRGLLVVTLGHFRVASSLCFKARLSLKSLAWKWCFILIQIKLIFTRKVLRLAWFWKLDTLELRNGVLLAWTLCLGFVDQSITVVNETFKAIAIFRVQNKDWENSWVTPLSLAVWRVFWRFR